MRVQVAGRHVDVGQALQTKIIEELTLALEKYSSRASDAVVTVGKDGVYFTTDLSIHLDSGILMQAQGAGPDAHIAFETALDKLEKRVRRYRKRLKNHKNGPLPAETGAYYVLAAAPEDEHENEEAAHLANGAEANGFSPLIIAETQTVLRTMPVATAVLQLEVSENPALMFRNAASGKLNMVYRRADGNIGWVDPAKADAG
jgi:ribosomal subunit interface protein